MAKNDKEIAVNEESKELDIFGGSDLFSFDSFADFASETGTTGLETVDQTDIKLPKIKLIQMTSEEFTKDGIKPGSFYNVITKEAVEEFECTLLALGKSKVMWPATFKRGDKPLCRSNNGSVKTEGIGQGDCATCKYSQWTDGEKPPCTMSYVWLGLDKKGSPFRITAGGKSVSPTKNFINEVMPKLSRGGNHIGIFVLKMKLKSVKESNDKGTFFVIDYETVGTINPGDKQLYNHLQSMSESLSDLFLTAIENDNLNSDSSVIIEQEPDSEAGVLF